MVYTFSEKQLRKLKGYFARMRKEGKRGYENQTLNKATDYRLFCEYWEAVSRGYIKDDQFFATYHPSKLPWFNDELLLFGPQGIKKAKVLKYLAAIELGDTEGSSEKDQALPSEPPTSTETREKTTANLSDSQEPPINTKNIGRKGKPIKKLISLKIDPELYEMSKLQADKEGRTFAGLVRHLLNQHLEGQK